MATMNDDEYYVDNLVHNTDEYFQEEEASVLLSDRQIFVITEALRMGSNLVSHSHFWDPSATTRLRCC